MSLQVQIVRRELCSFMFYRKYLQDLIKKNFGSERRWKLEKLSTSKKKKREIYARMTNKEFILRILTHCGTKFKDYKRELVRQINMRNSWKFLQILE